MDVYQYALVSAQNVSEHVIVSDIAVANGNCKPTKTN